MLFYCGTSSDEGPEKSCHRIIHIDLNIVKEINTDDLDCSKCRKPLLPLCLYCTTFCQKCRLLVFNLEKIPWLEHNDGVAVISCYDVNIEVDIGTGKRFFEKIEDGKTGLFQSSQQSADIEEPDKEGKK